MASPAAKRRRLDLLSDGARRSPRLQDKVTASPRRSGRLTPKKLFSSQENQRKESLSSSSFYNNNNSRSNLFKDDFSTNNQTSKSQNAGKGKRKNKLWSNGPHLGGRGIPVGKMDRAKKSQQRSQTKKSQAPVHTKKQTQKRSPKQKPVLQEVSLGRLSISNTSPGVESSSAKKFFKSRDRRPETVVLKAGFEMKFKCDAGKNTKSAKKDTVVRKKRLLSPGGGTSSASKNVRPGVSKGRAKENKPGFVATKARNNQNTDIPSFTGRDEGPSLVPRTPKTPTTREEEMLASWGFDCSFEMPTETKTTPRITEIRSISKQPVLSPQDLLLTPLEEDQLASIEKETVSEESDRNGKHKLFPVFTRSAQSSGSLNGTPASSPGGDNIRKKLLRGNKDKDRKEQYMLDVGQKLTGIIQCPTCGMSYNGDDESDGEVHEKFHNDIMKTLSFQGWKCENVVREFDDGSKILMVYADNKKQMLKVRKIQEIVDMELGFAQTNKSIKPHRKIFLYVSPKKEIVGYCLAEPLEKAFKLITDSPRKNGRTSPCKRPLSCSNVPVPVKCGVNRIWVFHGYRHQGVATKLLECVRFNFLIGRPLTLEELAYTDPTPDGRALFTQYNGHAQYLVYN